MTALVEFDNGETETYSSENNETITLAYASTVHKAQGSEYASIIMCLLPFHKMMLRRNILYTGITRAKTKCTIFTTPETLASSIHNNSIENRHTMLGHYLRKKYQENFQQLRFNA
jgi:exodeoxyribonuclease V alpha subunit